MSKLQSSTSMETSSQNNTTRKRRKLANYAPPIASSSEVVPRTRRNLTLRDTAKPLSNLPIQYPTAPEAASSNGHKCTIPSSSSEKDNEGSDIHEPESKKSRFSDETSCQSVLEESKTTSNEPREISSTVKKTGCDVPEPSGSDPDPCMPTAVPSTSAPSKRELFEQKLNNDKVLKQNFLGKQFLSNADAELIGTAIGLAGDAVQKWFENQREGVVRDYIIDENNDLPWQMEKLEHGYQKLTFMDCVKMARKWGIDSGTIKTYFEMRGRFPKCCKVPKKVLPSSEAPSTSGEPLQPSKLIEVSPRPDGYSIWQHNYLEKQYVPGHTAFFYCQEAIQRKAQLSSKQVLKWYVKRIKWDEEVASDRVRRLLMPHYRKSKNLWRGRPHWITKQTKLSVALISAWFWYQKNKDMAQAQPSTLVPTPDSSAPSAEPSSTSIAPVDSDHSGESLLQLLASSPVLSMIQDSQEKEKENQMLPSSSAPMPAPVDSGDSGASLPQPLASTPNPPGMEASQKEKNDKEMEQMGKLCTNQPSSSNAPIGSGDSEASANLPIAKELQKKSNEKQMGKTEREPSSQPSCSGSSLSQFLVSSPDPPIVKNAEKQEKEMQREQPSSSASNVAPVDLVEVRKNDQPAPDAMLLPTNQGQREIAVKYEPLEEQIEEESWIKHEEIQVQEVPQDLEDNFEVKEEIDQEIPKEIRRFLSQWYENNSNPTVLDMETIGRTYRVKGWQIFKYIRSQKVIRGLIDEQDGNLKVLFNAADITRIIREIRKHPLPTFDDIQNLAVHLEIEGVEMYKLAKEMCYNK